ncbi:hypothetical protein CES85_0712 [Ochrobactrum quorumnocens]|uniref:Uncharacterized protein n=1 Tax=Ochrobactrum quorumnocens TaxID=271865 RepID=A0A248UMK2_9HYPH|nr:hypothetical protein CES85_0712 [[Ochrobactrum] quorumnocens]
MIVVGVFMTLLISLDFIPVKSFWKSSSEIKHFQKKDEAVLFVGYARIMS